MLENVTEFAVTEPRIPTEVPQLRLWRFGCQAQFIHHSQVTCSHR